MIFWAENCKAPAKRWQHANATYRNIVGRNMLRWHVAFVWPGLKLKLTSFLGKQELELWTHTWQEPDVIRSYSLVSQHLSRQPAETGKRFLRSLITGSFEKRAQGSKRQLYSWQKPGLDQKCLDYSITCTVFGWRWFSGKSKLTWATVDL